MSTTATILGRSAQVLMHLETALNRPLSSCDFLLLLCTLGLIMSSGFENSCFRQN